uniref:Uncharacterized protein n=1 Tax=Anguilla anguilla TaxID=7936 RepID=A0A0E9QL16_ANGAN
MLSKHTAGTVLMQCGLSRFFKVALAVCHLGIEPMTLRRQGLFLNHCSALSPCPFFSLIPLAHDVCPLTSDEAATVQSSRS